MHNHNFNNEPHIAPVKILLCQGADNVRAAAELEFFSDYEFHSFEQETDIDTSFFHDKEVLILPRCTPEAEDLSRNSGRKIAQVADSVRALTWFPPDIPAYWQLSDGLPEDLDLQEMISLAEAINSEWDKPIYFDELKVPEIPEILLPDNLKDYAKALADSAEVSISMVTASILGVLSIALCKKYIVSPWQGWNEPLNIYALIALPPASNKSLILKSVKLPMLAWEREQRKIKEPEIKRQESRRKSELKIIDHKRNEMAKNQDPYEQGKLMKEIEELELNLTVVDSLPKLFSNNTTPEALADDVFEQGGRFAVVSDEGGIMEVLAGLYSSSNSNIDLILQGIDGGDARITRKNSEYEMNPFLTFLLVVQPQIISNMSQKKAFTGNGMLERFLYVTPKSNLGYRKLENKLIPEELIESYSSIMMQLLNIELLENDAVRVLELSDEALAEWKKFRKSIEVQLRPTGTLSNCAGWGGKISGFALRLAGLIHVCETLGQSQMIQANAMHKALELAALFSEHAIAAFTNMIADQSTNDAKEILKWLQSWDKDSFTRTELTRAMRNKRFKAPSRLDEALKVLADRNLLTEPQTKPSQNSNKPTTYYEINPIVREVLK